MLTVQEILPNKLRQKFICGYVEVNPNTELSWRKKLLFKLWGGERYDSRASIENALHSHKVL